MSEPLSLKYGQTPWDDMPREELLRELQRAYAAAKAARSALAFAAGPERTGFWSAIGTGGRALAKCEIVVARVEEKFSDEDVYRAFFRYAVDLLFTPDLGSGWAVCAQGHMVGRGGDGPPSTVCSVCKGDSRPITWDDIAPSPSDDGAPR